MDPIGFGFENYDGIGRWRDQDRGFPVDASGTVNDGGDASGDFDGLDELTERLGASEEVRECLVTQWFRWAYGRGEVAQDRCARDDLRARFDDAGGSIRELLVGLTQTGTFLYLRAEEGSR
jgi:hypothetical protein